MSTVSCTSETQLLREKERLESKDTSQQRAGDGTGSESRCLDDGRRLNPDVTFDEFYAERDREV